MRKKIFFCVRGGGDCLHATCAKSRRKLIQMVNAKSNKYTVEKEFMMKPIESERWFFFVYKVPMTMRAAAVKFNGGVLLAAYWRKKWQITIPWQVVWTVRKMGLRTAGEAQWTVTWELIQFCCFIFLENIIPSPWRNSIPKLKNMNYAGSNELCIWKSLRKCSTLFSYSA